MANEQTNSQRTAPAPGDGAPVAPFSELPKDELQHLAEEYGLDPSEYKTRQHLAAALYERRQRITAMDREAMLDVVKWARRPVASNATREMLAQEIVRIRLMHFDGLSQRGLVVLARLRAIAVRGDEPVEALVKKLRKQEGLIARLGRKHRALLGSVVSRLIGDVEEGRSDTYQFLPPQPGQLTGGQSPPTGAPPLHPASIKEEIEQAGLIGGLAGRIKREADVYLNQKLDEIEARIDRKLDEIDRRLAEWRDREIANRIRILKITLWASVIVAAVSLVYSYVKVYFWDAPRPAQRTEQVAPARGK